MLSPIQSKAFSYIHEAVPEFPEVISHLVSSYLPTEQELLSLALTPIWSFNEVDLFNLNTSQWDKWYFLHDIEMAEAIKYFFSSSICDPKIKSQIIRKFLGSAAEKTMEKIRFAADGQVIIGSRFHGLNCVLDEMRKNSTPINLNSVDLSHMNLVGLRLNNISAIGANFRSAILSHTILRSADLRGADFSEALIENADLESANLYHAYLASTRFSGSNMRFVNLTRARFFYTVITANKSERTDLTGFITSDKALINFLGRFKKYFSNELIVSGDVRLKSVRKIKEDTSCIIG